MLSDFSAFGHDQRRRRLLRRTSAEIARPAAQDPASLPNRRRSSRRPTWPSIIRAASGRSSATRTFGRPATKAIPATASWSFTPKIRTAGPDHIAIVCRRLHPRDEHRRAVRGRRLRRHAKRSFPPGRYGRRRQGGSPPLDFEARNEGRLPAQRPGRLRLRRPGLYVHWAGRKPRGRLSAGRHGWPRAFPAEAKAAALFRCSPDGTDLTLWATGFWNPHASCVDAFGRMFTVDNDPDDRPPLPTCCTSSRGATTAIASATAAAASIPSRPGTANCPARCRWSRDGRGPVRNRRVRIGRVPRRISRQPARHLLGRSSHRSLPLHPQGTSLTAKAEPLIVGGENFRPVGVALAPDGSLFATDWVLKDYNVHGHGRIWRIAPKAADARRKVDDLAAVAASCDPRITKQIGFTPVGHSSPGGRARSPIATPHFSRRSRTIETRRRVRRLEASWALAAAVAPQRISRRRHTQRSKIAKFHFSGLIWSGQTAI